MVTLDLEEEKGNYSWSAGDAPLPWSSACDLLGVTPVRSTRNKYRNWIGIGQGELLSPWQVLELDLMVKFVNHRGGKFFSRRNFLAIKYRLRLEVEPVVMAAIEPDQDPEGAIQAACVRAIAALFAEKYGIRPNPECPKVYDPVHP